MKRFTPFKTHSSPFFTAVVEMFATSLPASGSVRHSAPRRASGPVKRVRKRFFWSSVPMWMIGRYARPAPMRPVAMPAQPQFSSSMTMTCVRVESIPPPP